MRSIGIRIVASLALALAAAAPTPLQAGKVEIQSAWRRGEVPLDGSLGPWDGTLRETDRAELSVGMINDTDFLYLCLKSPDPRLLREAMVRGLIFEFEPKGGKSFRIQYPIGGVGRLENPPERSEPAQGEKEKMWEAARESLDTFLMADGGSGELLRYAADNGFGIRLFISQTGGELIYQAQIPLQAGPAHPHALEARPGSRLTLIVRTPERERSSMDEVSVGGMHGGMHRGGGAWGGGEGMHHGGGGGPMAGQRGGMPPPLDLKFKISLAVENAPPE
jgi:hypothetical protein